MRMSVFFCNFAPKIMYIAISGNIGAGKTTLTKMLAKYYGWEPRFESVSFNPYLEDYYTDTETL